MYVTNNHNSPLGLHTGVMLEPGKPKLVHQWDQIKKNAVIQAWMKAGILSESEPEHIEKQGVEPDPANSPENAATAVELTGTEEETTDEIGEGVQVDDQGVEPVASAEITVTETPPGADETGFEPLTITETPKEKGEISESEQPAPTEDEIKTDLIAKLFKKGIKKDKRASVESLQKLLEEAEENGNEESGTD